MTIDDDTPSSSTSSSTTYNRKITNPQQSSPIAHIQNIRSSFQSNTSSSTNSINKPVSLDYIQSIRANFQSLDDIILQTYTSKDSSSTSGAVQSPSDNVKSSSELASVSSSQLAVIGSVNGANNNGKDDDKDFVDIGNIQNNNTNNNTENEEIVQQIRGGTVDEKAAAVVVASVNNNDINNNRPSIDNSEISGATSISDYMPVSTSLPSSSLPITPNLTSSSTSTLPTSNQTSSNQTPSNLATNKGSDRRISWTRQNSYLLTSKTSNLSSTSLLTADSKGSVSSIPDIIQNNDISLKSELQRMKGTGNVQDKVQRFTVGTSGEEVGNDTNKTKKEDEDSSPTKSVMSPTTSFNTDVTSETVGGTKIEELKIVRQPPQQPARPRNLPVPPPPPRTRPLLSAQHQSSSQPRGLEDRRRTSTSNVTTETIGGTKIEELKLVKQVPQPSQSSQQPRVEMIPTTSSPSPRGLQDSSPTGVITGAATKTKKMVRVPSLPPPPPLVLSSIDEVRKSWSAYHSLSKADSDSDQLDPRSYSNQTCLGKHELDTTTSSNNLVDDNSGDEESSAYSDGSSIKVASDSTNSSMVGGGTSNDNTTTTGGQSSHISGALSVSEHIRSGLLVVPTTQPTSYLQKTSDITFNSSNTTSCVGNLSNKPGGLMVVAATRRSSSTSYPSDESDGNTISVKEGGEEASDLSINTNQALSPYASDNSGGLSVGSSGSIVKDDSVSVVTSGSGASEASLLNPSIKFAECKDETSPRASAREEKKVSLDVKLGGKGVFSNSIDDSDRTPRTSTPTLLDVIGYNTDVSSAWVKGLVAVDSSFETPPTKNTTDTNDNNEKEEDVIMVQSVVTGEPLRNSFNSLNTRGIAEDDQSSSSILTHGCNGDVVLTREMLNDIIGCNNNDGTDDNVPVRGISESTPVHSNVQDEKSGHMNIPGSLKMPNDDLVDGGDESPSLAEQMPNGLVGGGGVVNSSPDSSLPDTYRRLDGVGLSSTYASTKVYGTYDIQTKQRDGKSKSSSKKPFRRRASIGSTTLASTNSAFTIYEDIDPVDSVVTGGQSNYLDDKSVASAYSKRSRSMPRLDKPLAFLSRQQRPNISVPSSLNTLPDWRSSSSDVVTISSSLSGSCAPLHPHPWMQPLRRSVQSETSSEPSSTAWKSCSTYSEATSVSSRVSLLKQLSLKELQNVEALLAAAKRRISTELLVEDTSGVGEEHPQSHDGTNVDRTANVDRLPQELNENKEDDTREEEQHHQWEKRSTTSIFDEQLKIELQDLEHSNSTTQSTVADESRRLSTVTEGRRLTDNYMDVVGQKLAGFYRPKSSRMKAGPPVSRPDEELRRLSSLSFPQEDTADDRIDLDVLLASMSEEEEKEESQGSERAGSEDEVMSQQLVVRQAIDPEEASFAVKERTLALFTDSLTRYAKAYKESGVPVVSSGTTPTSSVPTKVVDLVPSTIQTRVYPECSTLTIYNTSSNQAIDTSQTYNGFRHTYITVDEEHRFLMLCAFLKRNMNVKIIIFFSTTKSSQYYCKLLDKLNFNVNSVHHGMSKGRFKKEIMDFTRSSGGSILCLKSDVGMNIAIPPSTTWLVQFEPPSSPTEYIYRIGRISSETNHKGEDPPRALLFLAPNQFGFLKYYKAANVKIYEYEVPKVKRIQKQIIKLVKDDSELSKLGRGAYRAYLDMYASHDYKDIYNMKDLDDEKVADTFGFEKIPYAWHVEEVSVQGDGQIVKKIDKKKKQGSPRKNNEKKKQKVTKKDQKTKTKVVVVEEKKVVADVDNKEREGDGHVKKKRSKSNFLLQSLQQIHEDKDKDKRKKAWEKQVQKEKKKVQKEKKAEQWKPVSNVSQWKPAVYEPQRSWMPGKKTWKASNVHADKMAPAWSTDYVW